MKTRLTPLLPLLLLAACATPASAPIQDLGFMPGGPPGGAKADCDVTVVFSSACCGMNRKALEGVRAAVAASSGVEKAVEWAWGREGERTLCVKTASPAAADALYARLAASRYPTDRHATTTVSSHGRSARLD